MRPRAGFERDACDPVLRLGRCGLMFFRGGLKLAARGLRPSGPLICRFLEPFRDSVQRLRRVLLLVLPRSSVLLQ